jgi:hypothetical protein
MSTRRASFFNPITHLIHPHLVFLSFLLIPTENRRESSEKRDDDQVFTARAWTTSTNSSGHTRQGTVETNRQGYSHRLNIPFNVRKSRTRVVANLQVFSRRSKLINNKARPLRLVATVVHLATGPSLRLPLSPKGKRCVCVRKRENPYKVSLKASLC